MNKTFKLGALDLVALSDGDLKTSADFVIGMERARAISLLGADGDGSVFIPVNNFLFRRDENIVLIDAGAGDSMQPTLGRLPSALREAGVAPDDVTHIVLTHIHPDHANGLVDPAGAAVFPNAEILVHAQEFAFWTAEGGPDDPASVKRTRARNKINLKPYLDRVRAMRDGEQALGCAPILAAGHSPGHTCWRVETGGDPLLAWGDCVHFSAIQIAHPQFAVTYDLDADMARTSRLRMLNMAASQGLVVAGAHVAAPGLGRVAKSGEGFAYAPL
jgi:glyoxylase-like metal-dependent hydrolase (beta-lactamase superfamily II)